MKATASFVIACIVLGAGSLPACRSSETAEPPPPRTSSAVPSASARVPLVMQTNANDCGAAAITMTLSAYGVRFDLNRVKGAMNAENLDLDASGLSALDLVNFAKRNGLGAEGIHAKASAVVDVLKTGDILHFNRNHFVVFDRRDNDRLVILDPALGRRELDMATFATEFSETALLFAASPQAMVERKRELGL